MSAIFLSCNVNKVTVDLKTGEEAVSYRQMSLSPKSLTQNSVASKSLQMTLSTVLSFKHQPFLSFLFLAGKFYLLRQNGKHPVYYSLPQASFKLTVTE